MDYAESRMHAEAARRLNHPAPEVATIFTPINLLLFSLFIYILYRTFAPRPAAASAAAPAPLVFQTFTPPSLLPYDGRQRPEVYLAVRGKVFDVTPGKNFYGPGGPYENFAGRDASRGLACGSFDESMLTADLEAELDALGGLGEEEMGALRGWEERFEEKYLVVGRLVSVAEKRRMEEEEEEEEEEEKKKKKDGTA